MTIAVTGLSHHTSPLALRERMALSAEQMSTVLPMLRQQMGQDSGVAILATCNRLEVYACAPHPPEVLHRRMTEFLGVISRLAQSEFAGFLYHHANTEAVSHLLRVAASLDSMVVGENEIMGQIQQMYDLARGADVLNRVLGTLIQRALKCGKRVRTETHIGKGKVSVASVAVDLAESILKNLSGKTAMIVGSGQVSEQALKSLIERGVGNVMVLNRTLERARTLAGRYAGEAIILEALPCHLWRADIVISSTGASELILRASDFERAVQRRGRAPMFVIDIAVPRDIEREAVHVDNVYCYDMDDLQGVAERNLSTRKNEIAACETIVRAETDQFLNWRHRLHAEPLIIAMTRRFHAIREEELRRTLAKMPGISETDARELECLSRRTVNALLREPIAGIKALASDVRRELLLEVTQQLFGLESNDTP